MSSVFGLQRPSGGSARSWGPGTRAVSGEAPGRIGVFWIAIWTFFLLDPLRAGWADRDQTSGKVGVALTIAFGVWYVGIFAYQRTQGYARRSFYLPTREALPAVAVAVVLAVGVCLAVGQAGTATAVYLCVLGVMTTGGWWRVAVLVPTVVVAYGAGFVVPGWEHQQSLLLSMLTASAAVYGVQSMIRGNIALRNANDDNQRLVVADERNRFARDLHDILGHSLTVITVKAELARRMLDVDPERARAELADLETLSRDALSDVRRAVEGYRELTLPGELTRARSALRAAQIEADLPNTTDEVPGDLRELFAWTVREGVTNVVRHSGARRCTIRLTATSAEVRDDGQGMNGSRQGNGLTGLRERAAVHGATVVSESPDATGHSLRVLVPVS